MEIFLVNSNGLRSLKLLRIPIHFYSVWSIKMAYLSNFDQHDIVMDSFKIPESTLVNGPWMGPMFEKNSDLWISSHSNTNSFSYAKSGYSYKHQKILLKMIPSLQVNLTFKQLKLKFFKKFIKNILV